VICECVNHAVEILWTHHLTTLHMHPKAKYARASKVWFEGWVEAETVRYDLCPADVTLCASGGLFLVHLCIA